MNIRSLFSLLFILFATFTGRTQSAGTTSFEFLRSQYSPRGAAMAGNLMAIKNDIHALLYNPAALSGNRSRLWSINYTNHLLDFQADKQKVQFFSKLFYLHPIYIHYFVQIIHHLST